MEASWNTSCAETLKQSLLVLILSLWLYWLWSRRNFYRFALQFPGCVGLPIVGILNRLLAPNDGVPLIRKLLDECKSHTICVWLGLYPVMLTVDPDVVQQIFTSKDLINKPRGATFFLKKAFGNGLLTRSGEDWQRNRKLVQSHFDHEALPAFVSVFNRSKNAVLSKLSSLAGTGEHNIATILRRASLAMIVETTMGKELQDGDLVDEQLAENYSFVLETTAFQILLSYLNLGFLLDLYPRFKKARKCLRNSVEELIISKLNSMAESKTDSRQDTTAALPEDTLAIKQTPHTFITHAIELQQREEITWDDVISETNALVVASFETTSSAMFSTIVMLAMHPEVQAKLYEEIVEVFPSKDIAVTHEHLKRLPYLDRVINETMRLIPPVSEMKRYATADTKLTEDLLLPKGLQIMISTFHLHRRTDIWGLNAGKFDPDHFLPENVAKIHPYAFVPFSKGVRHCIGSHYAVLAAKVVLAGLVRNFRFSTTFKFEDLQFVDSIAIKYVDEPRIQLRRR